MSGGTAGGKLSIAICDRCHFKYPYQYLIEDGNTKGLRVCPECSDKYDPQKLPQRQTEDVSLKWPRPDVPLTVDPLIADQDGELIVTQDGEVIQ